MKHILALILLLSSTSHAEMLEKSWPSINKADLKSTISIDSLQFEIHDTIKEISTVGISPPNLELTFSQSSFSIFHNTAEDIFGPKDKSNLRHTELYNLPFALEFAAIEENSDKQYYQELNFVFFNSQPVILKKYVKEGFVVYLWNPKDEPEQYAYIFIDNRPSFYRVVGQISSVDFDSLLSNMKIRN